MAVKATSHLKRMRGVDCTACSELHVANAGKLQVQKTTNDLSPFVTVQMQNMERENENVDKYTILKNMIFNMQATCKYLIELECPVCHNIVELNIST